MKLPTKLTKVTYTTISDNDWPSSIKLSELQSFLLQKIQNSDKLAKPDHVMVALERDYDGFGGDRSCTAQLVLSFTRPETDEELKERFELQRQVQQAKLEHNRKIKKLREERERTEYERLRKKFEKKK